MIRKKLTDDFYEDEFWSQDTKTQRMNVEFMFKLQKLRTVVGVPFVISSGWRTVAYNSLKGGATASKHLIGTAADIDHQHWDSATKHKFITAACVLGFSVGIYPKHFHVDNRMEPRVLWLTLPD